MAKFNANDVVLIGGDVHPWRGHHAFLDRFNDKDKYWDVSLDGGATTRVLESEITFVRVAELVPGREPAT